MCICLLEAPGIYHIKSVLGAEAERQVSVAAAKSLFTLHHLLCCANTGLVFQPVMLTEFQHILFSASV